MQSKHWRILLAEDNIADLDAHSGGHETKVALACEVDHYLTATDAISAMESAGADGKPTPHLILLDYNLPGGQGLDILAAAKNNPNLTDVPKAIISSFLHPEELRQATNMGAICVIGKPSSLKDFFSQVGAKIEQLLDGEAARKAPPASVP